MHREDFTMNHQLMYCALIGLPAVVMVTEQILMVVVGSSHMRFFPKTAASILMKMKGIPLIIRREMALTFWPWQYMKLVMP